MRLKELKRFEELLNKFDTDDMYDFLDLATMLYRRVETNLDSVEYLRELLSANSEKINVKEEDRNGGSGN